MTRAVTASATLPPRNRRQNVLGWVYYGGLLLLLGAILTMLLGQLLPARLAERIGFNSEGYVMALVLGAWIQTVLPRLTEVTRWRIPLAAAAVCLALALALYNTCLLYTSPSPRDS